MAFEHAEGLPVPGPCALAERDFRGCTASGCHGNAAAAQSAFAVVVSRLNNLLDQIWDDVDGDAVLDDDTEDAGLLPQIIAQGDTLALYFDDADSVTVAEGALWNAYLAYTNDREHFGDFTMWVGVAGENLEGIHAGAHKASGEGVHNPFLLEILLLRSIDAVVAEYGVTPSPGFDRSIQTTPPPGFVVER